MGQRPLGRDVKDDFKSTLHILAVDRGGLLADVTQQLSNMKIFIHALNSRQERGSGNAIISATISINGLPQLQNIIERLARFPASSPSTGAEDEKTTSGGIPWSYSSAVFPTAMNVKICAGCSSPTAL